MNTLYTYLHFIPFFLSVILSAYIPAIYQPYSWVFYFFIFAHGLMYSLYALYWVLRSQRFYENVSKGKIVKNWLTIFIASTIVIYINAVLIYFNIVPFYPSSSFVFSVVLLILIIWGFYSFDVFSSDMEKYKNSSLNKDAALDYSNELKRLMNDDKPFLNPELTLTSLSKTLGITSKQLSQIINQVEGKNYSQYIAELRVYQAVELLKTNKYKHYTMAAIAYECGFSSISSFNIAFKKITGKTPVQYKQTVKVY
ncbi:helix-turn-helix domain-containing protein [Galbibacter pacificus]|uniref:AraC family transcriptional regulator n=1 Tax=Galbibacter pacificus TaxID=2996052 RepID=A0ABT6FQH6_9FLAO|nr:AraC family transcriptional regulator [Galbibacter pacificus]MDG3582004.1 AraC family transcriptional regulator [Galbibacter pacificus]MDG3585522.1 AraC family transcriptional regulator [Galbibacter pacificus]